MYTFWVAKIQRIFEYSTNHLIIISFRPHLFDLLTMTYNHKGQYLSLQKTTHRWLYFPLMHTAASLPFLES